MPRDGEDYEIGFGKPPKHTQFKKGVSGNPTGRPKGSKSLGVTFNELAAEKMWVNTPNGRKRMSMIEMGLRQLLTRSAKGDPRAIREVIQMKRSFGDVLPQQAAPIIQVNFVKSRHQMIEAPPPETAITHGSEADDDDDYEPAE